MTAPVAPMEARCDACHDTGSLSQQIDGFLDCTACDAVGKRAELHKYLCAAHYQTTEDIAWLGYLFAQRQAAPVAPTQDIHCEAFHNLAMNYRSSFISHDLGESKRAYDALCAYINARLAPVAQPAQQVEAVKYGCHIDLPEGHHDNCVLDGGNRDDCTYARRYGEEGRKKCGEWKPIKVVKAQQAGDVALTDKQCAKIKAQAAKAADDWMESQPEENPQLKSDGVFIRHIAAAIAQKGK